MREDQPDDYVFHSIFVMYFHVFTVSEGTNSGAESSGSSGSDSPRPSSEMDLCSEGEIVEGEEYGEGVVVWEVESGKRWEVRVVTWGVGVWGDSEGEGIRRYVKAWGEGRWSLIPAIFYVSGLQRKVCIPHLCVWFLRPFRISIRIFNYSNRIMAMCITLFHTKLCIGPLWFLPLQF